MSVRIHPFRRVVINKFSENEDTLMRIEKAINPLLDDNSQVRFSIPISAETKQLCPITHSSFRSPGLT